eukprot:7729095-Heterocapsa_arctica.AAC.1
MTADVMTMNSFASMSERLMGNMRTPKSVNALALITRLMIATKTHAAMMKSSRSWPSSRRFS